MIAYNPHNFKSVEVNKENDEAEDRLAAILDKPGIISQDPLGRFGYGILSFVKILRRMVTFFLICAIIHYGLLTKYSSFSGL
jgi:hypothetical protein